MSPTGSPSSLARTTRRIILPERVLGKLVTNSSSSGVASGPTKVRTCLLSSTARDSVGSTPFLRITNTLTCSPFTSSGFPIAAASATAGWLTRLDSISIAPRLERQDRCRANQDHTGLGLPPGIHNGQFVVTDVLAIPHPRLWIDRFTHGTKDTQA